MYISSDGFLRRVTDADLNPDGSFTIPNGVRVIDYWSFYECKLTSLVVPENVTDIGMHTFCNQNKLVSFTVDKNNPNYTNDERGALFDKAKTVLIKYPGARQETKYVVPDGVQVINKKAFACSQHLTDVRLPNSLVSIEQYAFACCAALQNLNLPVGLQYIKDYACYRCAALDDATIPGSVAMIGKMAFCESGIKQAIVNSGVKEVKRLAFAMCDNLSYAFISGTVRTIGVKAFSDCISLKDVVIKHGVSRIGTEAFRNCGLVNFTMPNTVKNLGRDVLRNCKNLEQISIVPTGSVRMGKELYNTARDCDKLKVVVINYDMHNTPSFNNDNNACSVEINSSVADSVLGSEPQSISNNTIYESGSLQDIIDNMQPDICDLIEKTIEQRYNSLYGSEER